MTTEQYRQTILKTLKKYVTTPRRYQNVESKLIVSEDRNDYLIMIYGAHNTGDIHKCVFHLQIKDSKIVILRDNTQCDIFNKLIDAGLNGDRIIYSDISQYEIKDLDLTLSLEKIYEEHKSLFEVDDNFTKVIKPDIEAAELVKLASIGHEYINCAIAQHPNTPSSLLTDLFIKFPVQVLTNPILDLLLLEQPEFIDNIHDTYSRYFRSQGLDKSSDIRKWAVEQKEKNLYFDTNKNNVFPAFSTDDICGDRRYFIMQNLGKYSKLPLNTKNNPQELMHSLDRFLSSFLGDRQVEFKPDLEGLAARQLPLPLKYLYSFIGKYPGEHGDWLYTQDVLLNASYIESGKRLFLGENSGCWHCATEVEGNDPPVWIEYVRNTTRWQYVCDSLAEFLVTYCLQEALMGTMYRLNLGNNIEEIISTVRQKKLEITFLWQGTYASKINFKRRYKLNCFYLVEDSILIWGNWCGTNYRNAARLFRA